MKRTPFYGFHQEHGARFVDFAGWEMPIHYGSILQEHQQTRTSGGLFDVSHMGRIRVGGRHARKLLERVLTRRISDMPERACRYSLICDARGGVIDDVIVYRFDDHWLVVCNAANREAVLAHCHAQAGELSVKMEDQTQSTAMVAVQGPRVIDMIAQFSREIPTLKRYTFAVKNLLIVKMTVSRTGYTGEDGVEVILPAAMAGMALKLLLKDKPEQASVVRPCGLGARDTLRLEAGLPLYGHELSLDTDPLSAGLGFAVSLDKGSRDGEEPFVGQEALRRIAEVGPARRLVGLRLQGQRTPRQGMAVQVGGRAVGEVTSGCLSPTLGYPIAMAYVESACAEPGTALTVDLGSTLADAEVVRLPFYTRPG